MVAIVRKPTNKALAVLAVLREVGEVTCDSLAAAVRERTPCGQCNGTGKGDDSRYGCRRCYGHGYVSFHYSDAYQVLKQLRTHGLVTRRLLVDEWGDQTNRFVYSAVARPPADDLEALYELPAVEGKS